MWQNACRSLYLYVDEITEFFYVHLFAIPLLEVEILYPLTLISQGLSRFGNIFITVLV